MTRRFLQEVSKILWAYIHKANQRSSKVYAFKNITAKYSPIYMYQALTGCQIYICNKQHFPLKHKKKFQQLKLVKAIQVLSAL